MAFTDEDLQLLKASILSIENNWASHISSTPINLKGLVARLECAEKVILESPEECRSCEEDVGSLAWKEAFVAWRQSAGKEAGE